MKKLPPGTGKSLPDLVISVYSKVARKITIISCFSKKTEITTNPRDG